VMASWPYSALLGCERANTPGLRLTSMHRQVVQSGIQFLL
jgi:hypothetical protein